MAIDDRTANLGYLKPNPANLMKSEDVPRLITTLDMIDADMKAVMVEVLGKAPSAHEHEMGAIVGLLGALAGKSPVGHNHGIGTLGGVDLTGATAGQFMKFGGTLWIPAFIQAADLANKIITNTKLRDSDALTVIGRAAASVGSPGDISALANDTFLRRVGDALGFGKATIGMLVDILASKAEAEAGLLSSKLMTPERTAEAIAALAASQAGNVIQFTASGVYNKNPKARFVRVQVQGASGGSGGQKTSSATSANGGNGGTGAYAEAWFAAADLGASETVSVGAAGSAGTSAPSDGGNGGSSSFGANKIVAPGGTGGKGMTANVGANGTTANPTFTAAAFGRLIHCGVEQAAKSGFALAPNSFFGIGGQRDNATGVSSGGVGSGYGAPPVGGRSGGNNSAPGEPGQPGIVLITELF